MWNQPEITSSSSYPTNSFMTNTPSSSSAQPEPLHDFGPANFTTGRLGGKVIIYYSRKYPGHVFRFGCQTEQYYYRCLDCKNRLIMMKKANKEGSGNLKLTMITVKDGRIVGVDPDNPKIPHLCMNPIGDIPLARTYKRKKPRQSMKSATDGAEQDFNMSEIATEGDSLESFVLNMTNRENTYMALPINSTTPNEYLMNQVFNNAHVMVSPIKDHSTSIVQGASTSNSVSNSSNLHDPLFVIKEENTFEDDVPSIHMDQSAESTRAISSSVVNDSNMGRDNEENEHKPLLREGDIGLLIQKHIDKLENERSPNSSKLRNVSRFVFGILMEACNSNIPKEDVLHLEIGKLCSFVNNQQWMDLKSVYPEIHYLISKF